jgi:hypothetical protein
VSTFEDMLTRVLPYAKTCPDGLAKVKLINAAREFATRTRIWNIQATAIPTVANQATYTVTAGIPDAAVIAEVLHCEIQGGAEYQTQKTGSLSRQLLRHKRGNLCVFSPPSAITLEPAPPLNGQNLIVDVALKPDAAGASGWPDEFDDEIEYLADGAIGMLCAMPDKDWSSEKVAAFHMGRFTRRINQLHLRVSRSLARRPEAQTVWM